MMRWTVSLSALFWSVCLDFCLPSLRANPASLEGRQTLPDDYPDDYVFFQFTQHKPADPNRAKLDAGRLSYGIAYNRRLADYWIAGVGYRVKSFIRNDEGSLSLLTLSNHTQRIFRLYHPLYALLGSELSYMIPTTRISLPIVKDPYFSTEIGVGLNASLWYFVSPHLPLELRVMRWRGTKTNNLHGWESTMSLGYAF